MSLYALFLNGKEYWIVIQNRQKTPNLNKNAINSSLGHKSTSNLPQNFAEKCSQLFDLSSWQRIRQKNKQTKCHINFAFFSGDNYNWKIF